LNFKRPSEYSISSAPNKRRIDQHAALAALELSSQASQDIMDTSECEDPLYTDSGDQDALYSGNQVTSHIVTLHIGGQDVSQLWYKTNILFVAW